MTIDLKAIKASAQITADRCPEHLVTVPAGVMLEILRDVERLDWLDGQYSPVIDGQTASDPEGEVVAYRWSVEDQSSSVRDAIDYGMSKEAK